MSSGWGDPLWGDAAFVDPGAGASSTGGGTGGTGGTAGGSIAINPNQGSDGSVYSIAVTGTGTNFVDGTTAVTISGAGATISNVVVASATSLSFTLELAANTVIGARTVTTATGAEAPTAIFTVLAIVVPRRKRGDIGWSQIRDGVDGSLGAGPQGQSVDQTLAAVTLAGYAADGITLTKTDVAAPAAGTILVGSTGTGGTFPVGSLYGQVPRGTLNGTNRAFYLDYLPAIDYMWLVVNGTEQKPPIDGLSSNPSPDYTIDDVAGAITYTVAPKSTDWHYVKYFIKSPAPPIPTITAATLFLTTAHYPSSSGFGCNFGAMASFSGIATIVPVPDWFHSQGQWDKKTDSVALTTGNGQLPKFIDGTINLIVGLEQDGSDTGDFSPAEEYWIYDCYIVATYSDSSTHIWRPTVYSEGILTASSVGSIANPGNTIDADDTTYAVLSCSHFMGGGLDGIYINLNTFTQYT